MSMSNVPVPINNPLPTGADLSTAIQFTEGLPLMLVTLLERRYLTDFQPQQWRITPKEGDIAYPLLREVVELGRPRKEGQWAQAMPHVLTACHEPGHTLMMVLHGQGDRHRLYLGGRRLIGTSARSTEDYLFAQESAFKAYFTGLQMSNEGLKKLDNDNLPEMATLIQTAPALSLVTGIPSGRGGRLPLDLQSLDRLVKAVGNQHFVLMVVAEPLEAQVLDQTLDACRRLKSEIHAYTRRTISRTRGQTEGITHSESVEDSMQNLPVYLYALTTFLKYALPPQLSMVVGTLSAGTLLLNTQFESRSSSRQIQTGKSLQESGSLELLDANAEACEQLLQRHLERLTTGRSSGWWRTALYIAAENEATQHSVLGALRSLGSGDATALDPLRVVHLPPHILRSAVERGQILNLHPTKGNQGHPLGASFDALATCLSSEELAVVVNLPQQELPGLPMRDRSDFALSVPSPASDSISLGTLQDNLGRDLGAVTLTSAELNRHCFVTGITGYGKTNTCMQILLEAYDKLNVPFLVIEPAKTEYRRLAQHPQLKGRLRVYSLGGESPLPFRLNPLSPVPEIPLGRHIDLLKAVFNASFPMFAGMPYVLEEAILDVYTERGWSLYTSQNPFLGPRAGLSERSALTPCLQELHDQIEVVMERKKYALEVRQNMGAALRARLQSLMKGNKGLALNTRRSVGFEDLFASPTVIELQNLGDDEEKAFVMALLFTLLYEYAEVRMNTFTVRDREKLHHLTLIEEAHRLLQATRGPASPEVGDPRAKAVSMFTDMLAEMRAYGEGFIIADQIPTKLAPETLKNSNLKIVHRLVAPDDRQVTGNCINLNDQQMRYLNNLAPGYAVVHSEGVGEAVLTKIHQAKEYRAPDRFEAEFQRTQPVIRREDKIYLYRHAGCRSCPSPCDYFYQVEETNSLGEATQLLHPFLGSVLLDDADQAWRHWSRWAEWLVNVDQSSSSPERATKGVRYCTATQVAYYWLSELLVDRGFAFNKEHKLSPKDRLLRERAADKLSELIWAWTNKTELDDDGRKTFARVRSHLLELVAATPPRTLEGCLQCPVRCRMLPYVAPHLAKLEKSVAMQVAGNQSATTRLEIIRRLAEQSIPLLATRKDDQTISSGLLYCLLTNTQVPATASASRDELQDLLREQIETNSC
jgi:Helicase HerA, central domain